MKLIPILSAALLAAGCVATTAGLAPSESRSGYDGARIVSIAPHAGACNLTCPAIGAQWSSKAPDFAIVTVRVTGQWVPITAARLMIDGQETVMRPMPGITNLSRPGEMIRDSSRDFQAPMSALRSMSSAGKVWLRVDTTDGSSEVAIVDGATESKALHAMRRFLAQVESGTR